MSETTIRPLPKWIWVYGVVVMIIMSLGIAVVLLVGPGALPPELSGSLVFGGPFGLLGLNVARHLATALAAAFALYRRSANMMLLLFMIRILFDIPEYTFSVISGDYLFPFVLFLIFVYWVPSVWGVRTLWHTADFTVSETTTRSLPLWIWIYAVVVMVGMSLALVVVLLVSPGSIFPELAGVSMLDGPTKIFISMNLAAALATIFALYRRAASMMLLLFMMVFLQDISDYAFSIISGEYLFPFVLFLIFVIWVPSAWGVRSLWRSKG